MARMSVVSSSSDTRAAASTRPRFAAFVNDAQSEAIIRRALPELASEPDSVQRADAAKTVAYLSEHRSPDLLIVDLSGEELPLSRIRQLAEVCEPGVQVIAIGNRNEISLYRDLVHSGIADYVVKPLTAELVTRAVEIATRQGSGTSALQKLGKVIAVMGTRGGIGTTTFAVNLAWHLANRVGRRVAFVDLDLQGGDSSLMLGVKPTSALREAVDNASRVDNLYLERVMVPHGERLFVLTGEESLGEELRLAPEGVGKLIGALQTDFHYVVLDVPRTPTAASLRVIELAAARVLVADETIRSAREIVRLRRVIDREGGADRDLLVINRDGERRPGYIPRREFLSTIEMRPGVIVPLIPKLRAKAADYGGPLAAHRGPIAQAIKTLAGEVSGQPTKKKWWTAWR